MRAAVATTAPKISQVIAEIRSRAPRAKVFMVGYPSLFPDSGVGCTSPVESSNRRTSDGDPRAGNPHVSTAMVRRNIKHVATRALANTTTQASTEPPPAWAPSTSGPPSASAASSA